MFSTKLPMNPWLFIVSYIGLASVGALTSFQPMKWAMLASVLALGLHLAWIIQAGLYSGRRVQEKFGTSEKREKQQHLMIGALICAAMTFLVMILGFSFFADPESGAITGPEALPFALVMLFGFASVFTLIFQTATILCQAEEKDTGERVFVTCLALFYLVIGAPFLFRRLKRLDPVVAS